MPGCIIPPTSRPATNSATLRMTTSKEGPQGSLPPRGRKEGHCSARRSMSRCAERWQVLLVRSSPVFLEGVLGIFQRELSIADQLMQVGDQLVHRAYRVLAACALCHFAVGLSAVANPAEQTRSTSALDVASGV